MIKEKLLALLEQVPAGADIRLEQPSHDYWHTQLAVDIHDVREDTARVSAYHDDKLALTKEWDEDADRVWVLC